MPRKKNKSKVTLNFDLQVPCKKITQLKRDLKEIAVLSFLVKRNLKSLTKIKWR